MSGPLFREAYDSNDQLNGVVALKCTADIGKQLRCEQFAQLRRLVEQQQADAIEQMTKSVCACLDEALRKVSEWVNVKEKLRLHSSMREWDLKAVSMALET